MRSPSKMKIFFLSACLPFMVQSTGCSFSKMFAKKKSRSQIRREKQKQARKEGKAALAQIQSGKVSCDKIEEVVKKAYKAPSRNSIKEKYNPMTEALAKCDKWDFVFRRIARVNYRMFVKIMAHVESKGHDPHTAYDKWLNAQKHPYFNVSYGNYSLRSIRGWLQKSAKKKSHCETFAKAAERTYETVEADGKLGPVAASYNSKWNRFYRSGFVGYLYVADCRQHVALVRKMLTSKNWRDRSQACDVMARWGTNKDLKDLRTIASTDDYSTFRRRVRVWPVRDMCRKAAGRVAMKR